MLYVLAEVAMEVVPVVLLKPNLTQQSTEQGRLAKGAAQRETDDEQVCMVWG